MRSKWIPTTLAAIALTVSATTAQAGGIRNKDVGAAIFGAAIGAMVSAAILAANQKDGHREKSLDHVRRDDWREGRARYEDRHERRYERDARIFERRAEYSERQARRYERQARYFDREARHARWHTRNY
jgi:hypothetical protein